MIAEFSIENFFSIKSAQKISFEPSSDTFMSDEYSCEVKDGVRLLKVGIIYGSNASGKTNHILSETLIVYDSIRPTKLYSRCYDAATDSTTINFGTNLKMTKKSQDVISGNTINNCSVLATFGKSNVERIRLNDVYDFLLNM